MVQSFKKGKGKQSIYDEGRVDSFLKEKFNQLSREEVGWV